VELTKGSLVSTCYSTDEMGKAVDKKFKFYEDEPIQ
jgi:hypothetical protein